MPQIGPLELLVLSVIALIVFGPRRLPEIARQIGRTMADMRQQLSEIKSEFDISLEDPDERVPGTPSGQRSASVAATGPEGTSSDPDPVPEDALTAQEESPPDETGYDERDDAGEN